MTDRLRPALVFPTASQRGGVERITWEALRHLGARHQPVFVGEHLDPVSGVTFERAHRPTWGQGALRPAAFRHSAAQSLRRFPADVTVSFGVNAPPGDVYVVNSVHRAWLAAGRDVRIRGVGVPNAARYALPRHQVLLALEWDYFRRHRPKALVAVSPRVVDDLSALYGLAHVPTHIIPNGFDAEKCNFGRRLRERDERRALAGIDHDAIVLLFVANELHRKGLGVLLDAVGRLADPRVEVHVFGRTPLDAYDPQISALGLTDKVRYHGSTDDIGLAHALADVLVMPTQYEAFALTVVEALASGLPVITTAVPGAADLVDHDVNGLVQHDPLDAEELHSLLAKATDGASRARWAAAAPVSVAGYDWTSLMTRLEHVLLEVA